MTDVERTLRGLLTERAADAPAPAGLLGAVHARRHRARRRRIAVVGVVAVVALALGVTFTQVRQRDAVQVVTLPTQPDRPPPSPVGVGWLPPGFGKPEVYLLAPRVWAVEAERVKPYVRIAVQIMPAEPPARRGPGQLRSIDLDDGTPATLYTVPKHEPGAAPYGSNPPEAEGPYSELIFQRRAGQWVRIIAQNASGNVDMGITEQDLRRIARGLVSWSQPVRDLLSFASVPDGVVYGLVWGNSTSGSSVCFTDPGAPAVPVTADALGHSGGVAGSMLSVRLQPKRYSMDEFGNSDPNSTQPGTPIKVGSRNGRYWNDPSRASTVLTVDLPAEQRLTVVASTKLKMTPAELARFAAGITPGEDHAFR